jgi:HAE1 family hydrophobic/amphiphilic exporter-1
VVRFEQEGAATSLRRVNQQFAVTFFGNPLISLGDAMTYVNQAGSELPQGYSISFAGQAEEMRKAGGSLVIVFGMAIVLLYLVLASQFNSYRQPLLIMLAQPLAVIGGIGALAATGQTLNIYSMIGLVLLVGLVAKNSILLVDRANQLVESGIATDDALRQACPERLRPVLMTSLTVMLAMLPAALGFGAGAENNQPLSIAIIGGMASSTLLTLLVVPAAYSLFVRSRAGSTVAGHAQAEVTPSQ